MKNISRFLVLLMLFPAGSMLLTANLAFADTNSNAPHSELAPEQVVVIVIDALKTNDPSKNDDGIATVFNFASPGNKSTTGPLARFTKMIKNGFADMLNHSNSEFGPMDIDGNTALQAVWLTTPTGKEIGYVFQIGKQKGGEFDGMWMTESVWPIGDRKPSGQSI